MKEGPGDESLTRIGLRAKYTLDACPAQTSPNPSFTLFPSIPTGSRCALPSVLPNFSLVAPFPAGYDSGSIRSTIAQNPRADDTTSKV
jgi:hypothetical protein